MSLFKKVMLKGRKTMIPAKRESAEIKNSRGWKDSQGNRDRLQSCSAMHC